MFTDDVTDLDIISASSSQLDEAERALANALQCLIALLEHVDYRLLSLLVAAATTRRRKDVLR